jgi:hypothetical protein
MLIVSTGMGALAFMFGPLMLIVSVGMGASAFMFGPLLRLIVSVVMGVST